MIIGISGKALSGKDTIAKIIQCLLLNQDKSTEIPFDKFDLYKKAATWKNVKFADKLKDMVCLLLGCTREELEDREFKEKELGEEWIRYAFADGFFQSSKGTVMNSEPCSKERYEEELRTNWQTAYKLEHTPRTILQMFGTQCGRFIHPNIWINATMVDYTEHSNWIISDVRFPNETEAIKNRDGIIIRVERFTSIKNDLVYFKNDAGDSPINGIYRILEVKKDNCTLIDDKTGYSFGAWFEELSKIKEHESETALDDYEFDYIIDNDGTIEDLIEKVKEILIKEKIIYDNKN